MAFNMMNLATRFPFWIALLIASWVLKRYQYCIWIRIERMRYYRLRL